MIRTALDTNVIVASVVGWHEFHETAFAAVERETASGARLVLPLPALVQSYSVMTRLPRGHRIAPDLALRLLKTSYGARAEILAPSASTGWPLLEDAVASGVAGGASYDFQILRTAVEAGIERLLTLDADDFRRFGDRGVAIVAP